MLQLAVTILLIANAYQPTDAERARWTMSDMRSLTIAVEAYRADKGTYPQAACMTEMLPMIHPAYIRKAPSHDAWGTAFRYAARDGGRGFEIISAGADRKFDETSWAASGESSSFNHDAVVRDGRLVRPWEYR